MNPYNNARVHSCMRSCMRSRSKILPIVLTEQVGAFCERAKYSRHFLALSAQPQFSTRRHEPPKSLQQMSVRVANKTD